MAKKFPILPKSPEKICWGCDKYCSAKELQCGNGSERIPHPRELDGDEWYRTGDWQDLLIPEQYAQLGLSVQTPAKPYQKPHIKLSIKKSNG